jgi:hypothetical protein
MLCAGNAVFVRRVGTWAYTYCSDGLRASEHEQGGAPVEFHSSPETHWSP